MNRAPNYEDFLCDVCGKEEVSEWEYMEGLCDNCYDKAIKDAEEEESK